MGGKKNAPTDQYDQLLRRLLIKIKKIYCLVSLNKNNLGIIRKYFGKVKGRLIVVEESKVILCKVMSVKGSEFFKH